MSKVQVGVQFEVKGFPVTLTIVGEDSETPAELLERVHGVVLYMAKAGYEPPNVVPAAAPPQAEGERSFPATTMEYGGKTPNAQVVTWRVKGGEFLLHGVDLYPEVLEASVKAGVIPKPVPGEEYDMRGITAYYILKENGQPKKITRLERAQS